MIMKTILSKIMILDLKESLIILKPNQKLLLNNNLSKKNFFRFNRSSIAT